MTSNEHYPGDDRAEVADDPVDDGFADTEAPSEDPAIDSDPTPTSPTHLADDEPLADDDSGETDASDATPSEEEPLPPRALEALPPEPDGPEAPSFPAPVQPAVPVPGFQPGQAFPPPPYANSGNTAATQPPMTFSAPSQAYPPPPPGPAYPFAPPPPPKKSNKTQLLIGAGVMVLILAVVTGWTLLGGPGVGINIPGQNTTAKAAVQSYLEALASGNSTAALALAEVVPADRSLLTDAALTASLQRAPITEISVKDAAGTNSAVVTASYRLGSTPVTARFETKKVGSVWRLVQVARDVPLTGIEAVPVAVNGIPANSSGRLTLFPGSYQLTSTNDRVTVSGGEFTLTSPTDSNTPPYLSVSISPRGLAAARSAAQALLTSCVKQAKLAPTGCGFGVRADGVKVKTIKWRISSGADSLKDAGFQVTPSDPFVATVKPYIQLAVTVYDTAGRRYTGAASITTVRADLSGPDVVVRFTN